MNEEQIQNPSRIAAWTALVIGGIVAILLVGILLAGGCKAYNRYQAREDAKNAVTITQTHIQQEAQQVKVQEQTALVKVAEARGIHKAQEIINDTLTPLYVQHEAIQAQLAMANSPNHTEIYIPSGNNGVPLVQTLGTNK